MIYLTYAPHSGFGNQMIELRNAITLAASFNFSLILPVILDHFEISFGSCASNKHATSEQLWAQIHRVERNGAHRLKIRDVLDITGVRVVHGRLGEHCGKRIQLPTSCNWNASKDIQKLNLSQKSCVVLGSTFSMNSPSSKCNHMHFKESWVRQILHRTKTVLGDQPYDVAHYRLTEHRTHLPNISESNTTVPLVVMTDDTRRARRIVRDLPRRTIFSKSLFLNHTATEAIIADVILGAHARRFYPTQSSLSSFITRMRHPANC